MGYGPKPAMNPRTPTTKTTKMAKMTNATQSTSRIRFPLSRRIRVRRASDFMPKGALRKGRVLVVG